MVVTLNGIGLLLAALNIWTYPRQYTGAFILGNLLIAILVRNELFGRLLYLIVNTCFAKVHTYVQVIQCLLISLSSGLLSGLGSGVRLFCSISAGKFFGISGMCFKTDPKPWCFSIHSGCATSGCAWLLFRVVLNFIDHKNTHDAILITGITTNLFIAISILSAFPWVRNTHHK